jgi:plastocyanin
MRAIRVLVALGLILGSFGFATPVAAGDPCYHGFDLPPLTEGTDPQVKLLPCAFAPTVVRVAPGTTVEFFSGPYDVHLITGAGQQWGSRDVEVQPDTMVAYRFDRAGTYPYACALHRGMSGTIVVGNGITKAAAAGSAPAVVAVVGPVAKASAVPESTPSQSSAAVAVQVPVPAASVVADTAPASAKVESSNLAPLAIVAALLIGLAAIAITRLRVGRRSHAGGPLET